MTDALYAPVIRNYQPPQKRVPRKCSTCANRMCRERWRAVDWAKCREWMPRPEKKGGAT